MQNEASPTDVKPVFVFDHQNLGYQKQFIFSDLTLKIFPGESIALVGKSGSGKSTLLKALRAQQPLSTAWCPQENGLVPMLNVFHNVFMGSLHRHNAIYNLANLIKPFKHEVEMVAEWLDKLQLGEKLLLPVGQLSGGQQQRVSIARALFQQQDIFLGDEPVSALDGYQADKVLSLLSHQHQTLVLALHDTSQALKICSRIIGLRNGRIVLDEKSDSLCADELAFLYD